MSQENLPARFCNSALVEANRTVSRFGNAGKFMARFNRDVQAKTASNLKATFMGDYPTIIDVSNAYSRKIVESWMMLQLQSLNSCLNLKMKMTEYQINDCAICLLQDDFVRQLKISEFMLFIFLMKTGTFGDVYGRLDGLVIADKIKNDFKSYRSAKIDEYQTQIEREERERREARERDYKIPHDMYEKLKKLADSGNEKAKCVLETPNFATKTQIESFLSRYVDNYAFDDEKTSQNEF